MQIESNEIHVWSADLEEVAYQELCTLSLLSPDEQERAHRFRFPIHRERFMVTRSLLRKIISLYTQVPPQEIIFSYEAKKKPFLQHPSHLLLQFNLSHSDKMAVFSFTMKHAIGVDIEKVQEEYPAGITQRFFSPKENNALLNIPTDKRSAAFYRLWARKEAIIKATGKGLSLPLSSFSLSIKDDFEGVMIDNVSWSLLPLSIHPAYQSAVATNQMVKKMTYWKLIGQTPELVKIESF